MERKLNKKNNSSQYLVGFFFFALVFLLAFLGSTFLTEEYILRKQAVSLSEEARELPNNLTSQELNLLYREQKLSLDSVLILGYHQIREVVKGDTYKERLFITPPAIFETEMQYLKEHHYTSITPTAYLNFLLDKVHNPIPEKSVILTFDDGYATQYEQAYPVLKKYNLQATFFIYADCIDKYPICMTSQQLIDLVENGMRLANHTEHHVDLTKYKERTIKKEIRDNQKFLEKFGKANLEMVLAYPYGVTNQKVEQVLKSLNYLGGLGVSVFTKDKHDIFNLPRYLLGDSLDNFYALFETQEERN